MHLLTEERRGRPYLAVTIRKIRCETCNKKSSENIYRNHLGSQVQNLFLKSGGLEWRMCEIRNVGIRAFLWINM